MAFGLSGGGDFLPTVRYNAREGIFSRVDRRPMSDGTWANDITDITPALSETGFLADVANTEVGYIRYAGAVDFKLVHNSLAMPACPSDLYKPGFRMQLWLPGEVAEGACLRHFSSTAATVLRRIDNLHDEWSQDASQPSSDKVSGAVVPHVKITIEDVTTSRGTFKAPVFSIHGWCNRPEEWPMFEADAVAPATSFTTGSQAPQPEATKEPVTTQAVMDTFDGEVVAEKKQGDLPF